MALAPEAPLGAGGLALAAAVAAAAAAVALTPLGSEPLGQEAGLDPLASDDATAVELEALDVEPMGLHALRVHVDLAGDVDAERGDLQLRVQARDPGGDRLDGATAWPASLPSQGRWSGSLTLRGQGIVGAWEDVRAVLDRAPPHETLP